MTKRYEDNHHFQREQYHRRRYDKAYKIMAILYTATGAISLFYYQFSTITGFASIVIMLAGIGLWLYSIQLRKKIREKMIVTNLLMDVERRFRETDDPILLKISTGMWDMAIKTGVVSQLDEEILFQLFVLYNSIEEYNQMVELTGNISRREYVEQLDKIKRIILIQIEVIERKLD